MFPYPVSSEPQHYVQPLTASSIKLADQVIKKYVNFMNYNIEAPEPFPITVEKMVMYIKHMKECKRKKLPSISVIIRGFSYYFKHNHLSNLTIKGEIQTLKLHDSYENPI